MAQTREEKLFEALGLENMEPEEQKATLLQISELVFKNSILRMIEQMDEPTKEAFTALLETDPAEEVLQAFFNEHVPNADQAVQDTVKELTDDILAVTGASQD